MTNSSDKPQSMSATPSVIAKENLSAYQRWELASLTPENDASARNPLEDSRTVEQTRERELELVRQAAVEAGRAAGRADGLASATQDIARLSTLLTSLGKALDQHEQKVTDAVVDLALALAQHLVGGVIDVRRELLARSIAATISQLPELTQRVRLHLDPQDVALVRTLLDSDVYASACQVIADPGVGAGGFRIETEQGEIDGTLRTRWQRLAASLGRSYEWLEPA